MPPSSAARTAAIATPHPAAAAAAREVFLRGGNAIDAAVGAMLGCCVALPGSVGLGGYGGSLVAYLAAEETTIAIDFDSRAPLAYRPERFAGGARAYSEGSLAITVPAVVAGLALALERAGTMTWAAVSEPAIALAECGVTVSLTLNARLEKWAAAADDRSLRALCPEGRVPAAGTTWVQPDMARLLRRLAQDGPEAFYQGEIPRQIVRQVRDSGGILTEDDFARYRPEVVAPLRIRYRGVEVVTAPPPSGGLLSLQMLRTLEQFDLSGLTPWGAEYLHLVAGSARLAWRDRARFVGDPDATAIPIARLLSDDSARERAAEIRRGAIGGPGPRLPAGSPHTVNVVAADAAGNVVSLTATQGALFGSKVVIAGLGLVMGHGMSRFDLTPGSPNAPAAGKRMAHNMSPTVLLDPGGRPWAAVGLPGGPKIVTVTAQLVSGLVDFHASPAQAVTAGRVHVEGEEPLAMSSAVSDAVIEELRARGHAVRRGQETGGPPSEVGGEANALVRDPETGSLAAASQAGDDAALVVPL
jgi:gamma-glutamyltranspeptidase/glutathione hydrolase